MELQPFSQLLVYRQIHSSLVSWNLPNVIKGANVLQFGAFVWLCGLGVSNLKVVGSNLMFIRMILLLGL